MGNVQSSPSWTRDATSRLLLGRLLLLRLLLLLLRLHDGQSETNSTQLDWGSLEARRVRPTRCNAVQCSAMAWQEKLVTVVSVVFAVGIQVLSGRDGKS